MKNRIFFLLSCLGLGYIFTTMDIFNGPITPKLSDAQETLIHDTLVDYMKHDDVELVVVERHKVLRKEETPKHLKIYLRAYASSYTKDLNAYEGFQSPTILTYTKENNKWKLKDIWFPKDGSEYESSIRKAFPPNCVKEAMNLDGYDEEKHQAELEEVKALFEQA